MSNDTSEAAVIPKTEPRPEGQVSLRRNVSTSGYSNEERIRIMLCPELVRLRDKKHGKERGDLLVQRVSNAINIAMDERSTVLEADDFHVLAALAQSGEIMKDTTVPRDERIEKIRDVLRPFLKKGA